VAAAADERLIPVESSVDPFFFYRLADTQRVRVAHEEVRAPVLSLSTTRTRDDGAELARSCHHIYGEVFLPIDDTAANEEC
jgi:acyl-CoA reductase-like NAD-dependent aldehyde dehydrogenase